VAEKSTNNQDQRPSGPGWQSVVLAICTLAVLALALLPVAKRPGPIMPGINALFVAVILVTELSTSFLLLVRFRALPTLPLLLLGCAYFYSGLMSIPHLLTFPGAVLADRSLIDTSPQSTSWLYILWINGFSLLILSVVSLEARFGEHRIAAENVKRAVALGLCLTSVVTLTVVILAIVAPNQLPLVVDGQRFTDLSLLMSYLGLAFCGASIAIILLAIGERNRLFLWLSLALAVIAFANILSTAGGGRFTVGWTIGRLSWLTSACVLFIYLLVLHARDQHLWTRARDLLHTIEDEEAGVRSGGGTRKVVDVALERFIARENIMRFRRMLEEPHDETTRLVLLRMLAVEEGRLEQLGKRPRPSPVAVTASAMNTGSESC
jgi:Membrane-associated sensor, integral membrane domain